MADITITADTTDDPYSAYWERLSDKEFDDTNTHLEQSPHWQKTADMTELRTAELVAYATPRHGMPLLYLATDPERVAETADAVAKILKRAPDSLS